MSTTIRNANRTRSGYNQGTTTIPDRPVETVQVGIRSRSTTSSSARTNEWDRMVNSFQRAVLAANKSKKTLASYRLGIDQFGQFLLEKGMPTDLAKLTREHVESYMVQLRERPSMKSGRRLSDSTLLNQYKGLKALFDWAVEEGEIRRSPMEHIKRPHVAEIDVPVLDDDDLRKLLRACEGKDFYARRDMAILRILLDTGMRRMEVSNIKLGDIDWNTQTISIVGKGSRPRWCPFGRKTAQALDRYLRAREEYGRNGYNETEWLWLGKAGRLTNYGVDQAMKDRAARAGLQGVHLHMFRHTYAHRWLVNGGEEGDLMAIAGWKSRTMLSRYGKSRAAERAHEAHRRLAPGDQL